MFQRMKTRYNKEYQNNDDTLSNSSQDSEDEEEEKFWMVELWIANGPLKLIPQIKELF